MKKTQLFIQERTSRSKRESEENFDVRQGHSTIQHIGWKSGDRNERTKEENEKKKEGVHARVLANSKGYTFELKINTCRESYPVQCDAQPIQL